MKKINRTKYIPGLAAVLFLLVLDGFTVVQARTLSFATARPPIETNMHEAWQWWSDEITTRTDGSVEIKFHYMQSLVKLKDAAQAVSAGIADIGYMSPAYTPDKLPLWYLENTRTGSSDQYVVTEAFRRIRENFEPLKEEEKRNNMKYIAHLSNGPQVLLSKIRPYITPDDFNGDKVRMPGTMAKVARMAGWNVAPVSLYFAEIYSAMGRGTIDGAMTYVPLIAPHSQNEVGKYVVEPNLGQNSNVVMMNLNTWNSLTKKEQAVINELQDELVVRLARASLEDEAYQREALQNDAKNPLEFKEITEQQRRQWEKGLKLGADEMVKKMSQWNDHAAELHKTYRAEIDKVEAEVKENGYPWESD